MKEIGLESGTTIGIGLETGVEVCSEKKVVTASELIEDSP